MAGNRHDFSLAWRQQPQPIISGAAARQATLRLQLRWEWEELENLLDLAREQGQMEARAGPQAFDQILEEDELIERTLNDRRRVESARCAALQREEQERMGEGSEGGFLAEELQPEAGPEPENTLQQEPESEKGDNRNESRRAATMRRMRIRRWRRMIRAIRAIRAGSVRDHSWNKSQETACRTP